MIVANPFGSWVEGARAGQQDAIAMRNAMDEHAMRNYALQREQRFDPYNLQELQARARMANTQADVEGKYAGPMAAANLGAAQFKVPYEAAQLGIYGPLYQHMTNQYGTRYDPSGQMTSLLTDRNGNPMPFDQNMKDVMSPQRAMLMARGQRWEDLDEEAKARLMFQYQKAMGELNPGGQPGGNFSLGIPSAPVTSSPSGGFETHAGMGLSPLVAHTAAGAYNLPSQQNDSFKYHYGTGQLPNAYYNQGAAIPRSPDSYGIAHKFRPDLVY